VERFYPQEGSKDEGDALTDFLVWVLDNAARQVTHQTSGEALGQITPAGLVDQTGVESCFDRVQFQLCDQAFQPEDEPAIRCGRVVDRLLISDKAITVTAQIKKLIPIGAIACQARDIIGEDDSDLTEVDTRHEFLETRTTSGTAARDPQVGIDDLNVGSIPAECARTFGKGILEPKALLVIQDLLWAGLAGVDNGMTLEMVLLNVLGRSHGEPPVR
jgi:hypothetical protein